MPLQRNHVLGLTAILAIVAVAMLLLLRGGGAPPPPAPPAAAGTGAPVDPAAATDTPATRPEATEAGGRREAVAVPAGDPLLDPEIRAALTGFKGRVVDHRKQPVAGCGVRIYRGAMDSILPEGIDLFDESATLEPRYVAGETRTADDGTFQVDGVWPRAFYLLFAGIGTDAPSHRLLPHSPAPGEILDLGDVVLNDAAVVTGRVVDEDGEPVAGALVRGVDLPGQVLGFVPVERFDPDGAVLVREPNSPVQVLEMPAWVKTAFEHLPIPKTMTGEDGRFRLAGLVPGSNVIATTKAGLLSDVKSGVALKGGQEKDLGTIRLRTGEELTGRVVDTAGKPVPGAEVVAGSLLPMVPFDFARRIGVSSEEGKFAAAGFTPGKVSVAARRTSRDPWVLADPQPILGDVTVTLPAILALTVQVTGPDGSVVPEPKLRLLAGRKDEQAVVMATLGMLPSVDLRGRITKLEDGRTRIADLPTGRYVLLATSSDAATAAAEVDLTAADAQVTIALPARNEFAVRVVGPADEPIRNAAVYVEERGAGSLREMPFCAGRTGSDGRFVITQASSKEVRISADHPRWGTVHGGAKVGDAELVLRMSIPGWIEGVLTEQGKVPAPAKYTIAAEYRSQTRGATEDVPILATPGLDGSFTLKALQPGSYRVGVISSLAALTSPGGVMALAQAMYMTNDLPHETVEVVSGLGAQVELHAGVDDYTGPTGHVFGLAQIDGRLAAGCLVSAWTQQGRRNAKVDAAGRFDLGQVPVGNVQMMLVEGGEALMFSRRGLWNQNFELKEGEEREVTIELQTTSLAGTVIRTDGSPAAGLQVQARGRPFDSKPGQGGENWQWGQTDADGNFRFDHMAVGIYELEVETSGGGADAMRGKLTDVRADAAVPVTGLRLQLHQALVVAGRVDMSAFPSKPEWAWVAFHEIDPNAPERDGRQVTGEGTGDDGRFSTTGLEPGTYRVHVHASVGEWRQYDVPDLLVVPEGGLRDVVLRPVPHQDPQPRRIR